MTIWHWNGKSIGFLHKHRKNMQDCDFILFHDAQWYKQTPSFQTVRNLKVCQTSVPYVMWCPLEVLCLLGDLSILHDFSFAVKFVDCNMPKAAVMYNYRPKMKKKREKILLSLRHLKEKDYFHSGVSLHFLPIVVVRYSFSNHFNDLSHSHSPQYDFMPGQGEQIYDSKRTILQLRKEVKIKVHQIKTVNYFHSKMVLGCLFE